MAKKIQPMPPSPPRTSHYTSYEVLDNSYLLEEETYTWYDPETSHPVRIGEIFQSRYQVLGKLGYGSVSTAWLCRDLMYVFAPLNHLLQLLIRLSELMNTSL
jgi:hypothetical protein